MYVCRTVELVEENVSMQDASPTIAKKTLFFDVKYTRIVYHIFDEKTTDIYIKYIV